MYLLGIVKIANEKKYYNIFMLDCRVTWLIGSGAFSGKMLLVRIVENNKIFAYFRAC